MGKEQERTYLGGQMSKTRDNGGERTTAAVLILGRLTVSAFGIPCKPVILRLPDDRRHE
jgi:hypothetical protein